MIIKFEICSGCQAIDFGIRFTDQLQDGGRVVMFKNCDDRDFVFDYLSKATERDRTVSG